MNWADLFERAESHRTDAETIRERLDARRDEGDCSTSDEGSDRSADDGEADDA